MAPTINTIWKHLGVGGGVIVCGYNYALNLFPSVSHSGQRPGTQTAGVLPLEGTKFRHKCVYAWWIITLNSSDSQIFSSLNKGLFFFFFFLILKCGQFRATVAGPSHTCYISTSLWVSDHNLLVLAALPLQPCTRTDAARLYSAAQPCYSVQGQQDC